MNSRRRLLRRSLRPRRQRRSTHEPRCDIHCITQVGHAQTLIATVKTLHQRHTDSDRNKAVSVLRDPRIMPGIRRARKKSRKYYCIGQDVVDGFSDQLEPHCISRSRRGGGRPAKGLDVYLGILALLSISLGVLNLLPIPVLDGGHLLYYAIEAVIRRQVPERIQAFGLQLGLLLISGIMVLAIYNDVNRLL